MSSELTPVVCSSDYVFIREYVCYCQNIDLIICCSKWWFIRRRLVLGIIFASSLTYCIVSFLREGNSRNMMYQEILIERKPFVWRSLQEHKGANDSITCRNSVQGKLLLVDDRGIDPFCGGCPPGPRPGDLMLEGHEGANPYAGRRVANADTHNSPGVSALMLGEDDKGKDQDSIKTLTRLDVYEIFLKKSTITSRSKVLESQVSQHAEQLQQKEPVIETFPRNETITSQNHESQLDIDKNSRSEATQSQKHEQGRLLDATPGSSFETSSTVTSYENLSDRQKRRARKSLEESLEDQPLSKIIKVMVKVVSDKEGEKLKKSSAQDLEFVINECLKSPYRSREIANMIKSEVTKPVPFTPEEALSLIIDKKLTVDDYSTIQKDLKARGFHAYPPYYKVQIARKLCYPEDNIQVTEREASIPLFSLLLHTFRRIVQSSEKIINEYCEQSEQKDQLHCVLEGSWGFDGSTGQAFYKQRFSDDNNNENCFFATTYLHSITFENW
ncbi:hypothetical protein evm_015278 [Chilo suppressalis]|nr:hypothetical protein evm_015278 [Chilo suppressalis]